MATLRYIGTSTETDGKVTIRDFATKQDIIRVAPMEEFVIDNEKIVYALEHSQHPVDGYNYEVL